MHRFLGLLAVLVLAGVLQARGAVLDIKEMPDYYPLKAGTKWHYHTTTGDGNEGRLLWTCKIEKIDDKPLARLEALKDGVPLVSEHMSSNPQGVFRTARRHRSFARGPGHQVPAQAR